MPAVPITVPSVGESITEGIVSRWLKPDGSPVQAGEPLLELETDKATSTVPSPGSGVLKIGVAEGQTVAIGATVGTIDPSGTPAAAPAPERPNGQGGRPSEPSPAPATESADRPLSPSVRRLVTEEGLDVARVAGTGPGGRVTKGDVLAFLGSSQTSPPPRYPQPTARRPPGPRVMSRLGRPPRRRPPPRQHPPHLERPVSA